MRTLLASAVALTVAVLASGGLVHAEVVEVTATKIGAADAPQIDGKLDKAWDRVRASRVRVAEGSIGKVEVTMKAVYTDTDVFFLFQWPDKTMSLNRTFEFDGKEWKPTKGDEDRLSIMWDINNNLQGFQRRGCADLCHQKEKKFFLATNAPGERADLWHWKAQRTNPVGQADDQHLVDELSDGTGRRTDAQTSGGYASNWDKEARRPKYTFKDGVKPGPVLLQKDAVEVKDPGAFKKGDRLPREVIAPFVGSRGAVQAAATWERGRWTLELKRSRATDDKDHDVQFADAGRPYHFGLAVHDDSGEDEHSHTGTTVYRLQLK
jgi:hypothetical protein